MQPPARIRCANELLGQPIKGILESFHPLLLPHLIELCHGCLSYLLQPSLCGPQYCLSQSLPGLASLPRRARGGTVHGSLLSWNHVASRQIGSCFIRMTPRARGIRAIAGRQWRVTPSFGVMLILPRKSAMVSSGRAPSITIKAAVWLVGWYAAIICVAISPQMAGRPADAEQRRRCSLPALLPD